MGRSILHQRSRLHCPSLWHRGYLPVSLPPFCLVLHTVTQFCDWSHSSWGSLSTSINGYRHCSLCLMYMFLPRSAAKSHYLWSSPILSGCSSRHPQQKPQVPFFHPREALLVGHQVTAVPLSSCGILFFFTSYRGSLAWGGAGTPVPCMMAGHTQGNTNLMQWEEVSFSGGLVTIHIGSSLHKRGHQLRFDSPPPKSLLPTYPWSSSFPSRHLPSLVWGHQASSSLCLFLCHSTLSVSVLPQSIGLGPLIGQSSIYLIQKLHTHPHA